MPVVRGAVGRAVPRMLHRPSVGTKPHFQIVDRASDGLFSHQLSSGHIKDILDPRLPDFFEGSQNLAEGCLLLLNFFTADKICPHRFDENNRKRNSPDFAFWQPTS